MLFNYIKIAFRNLLKHKSFSAINLLGLSFSMSVCLLIINIINDQLSYDNFHKNSHQIYRVITKPIRENRPNISFATTFMPLGSSLKNEAAGIENVVRITKSLRADGKVGDKIMYVRGLFAEQSFFDVFSFELKSGDVTSALTEPFSVVLSEKTAQKFFGDSSPIGELIEFENRGAYTVTGVVKTPPAKSHILYDAIGSMSSIPILEKEGKLKNTSNDWNNNSSCYVYLQLEEGVDPHSIEEVIPAITGRHLDQENNGTFECKLQSLSSITPSPLMSNMMSMTLPVEVIWFMGFLALIVIFSACFNYTNLSISRALSRAKEVGVRKVSGAMKNQIILQFLVESVFYAFISLVFSIFIYKFLLYAFNSMSISKDVILDIDDTPITYLWFVVFSIIIGLIAGLSPALFLASFKPIAVLKNFSGIKLFSRITLRKALIVVQFTLSLFFIITAIIISLQSSLLIHSDYGFTKENIINIKLQDAEAVHYVNAISNRTDVIQTSASSHIPATGQNYGVHLRRNLEDETQRFSYFYVDNNYLDNLELDLLAGKNFPIDNSNNQERYIIINQKGVHELGFKNVHEAISESLILNKDDPKAVQIIGVVENYNHQLLLMDIGPMALRYKPEGLRYANVKVKSEHLESSLAGLEAQWKKFDQVHAFDYMFFDEQLEESYGFIKDLNGIITITAFLAIIVSCLGLLGMSIYNAESRTKEVGVRKVMGAKIPDIIFLLSKGFLLLLIIAVVIAVPLTYFANNLWLQMIANRIEIGFDVILSGILILLGLGIVTIGSQAIRAAFSNPIIALKDE